MVRAKKRKVIPKNGYWLVIGKKDFGDNALSYRVEQAPNGVYFCSCQLNDCSHRIAVMLHSRGLLESQQVNGSVDGGHVAIPNQQPNGEGTGTTRETTGPSGSEVESSEVQPPTSLSPPSAPSPSPIPAAQIAYGNDLEWHDPRWSGWQVNGEQPLPAWVEEIHPHQIEAVESAMDLYQSGTDVVLVDAPTGSGKSLVGDLIRRRLGERGLYVCHSKALQDQYLRDFRYAEVLKGRSNYPTQSMPFPEYTAADCTKLPGVPPDENNCEWCPEIARCQYEVAKSRALRARLAVVNTSYMLTECNFVGNFSGRQLAIVDECDVMEGELLGFVEFKLSTRQLETLNIEAPKKGSHKSTIMKWLEDAVLPAIDFQLTFFPAQSRNVQTIRKRESLKSLKQSVKRVIRQYQEDDSEEREPGISGAWVRDNNAGPMVLKPVTVQKYGHDYLWRHSKRWLLMSATIISASRLMEDLGIDNWQVMIEGGDTRPATWGLVEVPMTFPVENRPIIAAGVANMVYKEKDASYPAMAYAIDKVCERHPGERILVHTVSYDLARYLALNVKAPGRDKYLYENSASKDVVVANFKKSDGGIIFAPSLDRGVDFRNDECSVVVVAKVPFPYLGDPQINAKQKAKGGNEWYAVEAIRTLVQMTGRHVRSKTDRGTTYIFDRQFGTNLYKKWKHLFPSWWREAVTTTVSRREFM